MSVDMGMINWPTRNQAAAAAPEMTGTLTASSEELWVHKDSAVAHPVDVFVNGERTIQGLEVGADNGADPIRWRPVAFMDGKTCFMTGQLEPGRYVLHVRRYGQVVRAFPGVLRVTA